MCKHPTLGRFDAPLMLHDAYMQVLLAISWPLHKVLDKGSVARTQWGQNWPSMGVEKDAPASLTLHLRAGTGETG